MGEEVFEGAAEGELGIGALGAEGGEVAEIVADQRVGRGDLAGHG